jgi:hypothetical protein
MRRRGGHHILTLKWSGSPEKLWGKATTGQPRMLASLAAQLVSTWRGAKVLFVQVDVDPHGRREGAQHALQLAYLVLLGPDEDEYR